MSLQSQRARAFWSAAGVVAMFGMTLFASGAPRNAAEIKVVKAETVGMSSERLERIGVRMRRLIDAGKIPGR